MSELKWDEKMEKEFLDDCFVGLAFVDQRVRDTYLAARQRDAERMAELEKENEMYRSLAVVAQEDGERADKRIAELEEVIKKFGTIAFMRSASIDEVVAHFNMKAREQMVLEAENKELREANAVWAKTAKDGIPVYCVEPDPPTAPTEGT